MNPRHHRYRKTPAIRRMLEETVLTANNFIMPIFINENLTEKKEIKPLPGIYQHSLETLNQEIDDIQNLKISAVILFGIPKEKDEKATASYHEDGIIQKAIRQIKNYAPNMVVIADCCLCEYTSHGHCGVMENDQLQHKKTLNVLQKIARSYATAGCDIIAPSGMMDGMVKAIRQVLDENQFSLISIMSYAIKYASASYGPFREAAGSEANFKGDRKHHQMNPTQRSEAKLERDQDIREGADYIMVKPAGNYLDIIRDTKNETTLPIAAYQVSGEYAMLKQAAKAGIINEKEAVHESLISIKRAGASLIITYYAKEYALTLSTPQ